MRSNEQQAHCRVQGQVRFKAQFQHVEESYECNRSNDSTVHIKSAKMFARTALKTATPPRGCFRRCGTGCTRYGRVLMAVPVPAHTLYASGCASYARGWHRIRLIASMPAAVMHRPNCHTAMHTGQPRGWCSGCRAPKPRGRRIGTCSHIGLGDIPADVRGLPTHGTTAAVLIL